MNKARISLVGVTVGILVVFLTVSNFFLKDRIVDLIISKYEGIAIKQFEYIEYIIENSVGVVERIAQDPKIRRATALRNNGEMPGDDLRAEIKRYLESIIFERGEFDRIIVVNSKGELCCYSDRFTEMFQRCLLLKQFQESDDVVFCDVLVDREKKRIYQPITYPIYERPGEKGAVTGYLVAFFNLNIIDDSLNIIDLGLEGHAFLLNRDGMVISSSRDLEYKINHGPFEGYAEFHQRKQNRDGYYLVNSANGRLVKSIEEVQRTKRAGHATYRDNDDDLVIGLWRWLSYTEWIFLIEVDWFEAYDPILTTVYIFLGVTIGIFILVFVLGQMLAKNINYLLHTFMDSFGRGATGDISARYPLEPQKAFPLREKKGDKYIDYEFALGPCFFHIGTIAKRLGREVTCERIVDGKYKRCRNCPVYRQTLPTEVDEMGAWFNIFMDNIDIVVTQITDLIGELSSATDTMSATTTQFSESASNQAASAEEIVASVEESSANFENIAIRTIEQNEILQGMIERVDELSNLIDGMDNEVQDALNSTEQFSEKAKTGANSLRYMNEVMRRISSSSSEMIGMLGIINDISEQINLLSLNASIEAARAGEQGRGFAVVAEEISKLADKTAQSLKNIDELIRGNQDEISQGLGNVTGAVDTIGDVIKGFESISSMMHVISTFMGKQMNSNELVNQEVDKVKKSSEFIKVAAEEQKSASGEIIRSISQINSSTQRNAESSDQLAREAEKIADMAEILRRSIRFFGKKD